MYKKIIRPILFLFTPEASHHIVVTLLKIGSVIPFVTLILKKNFTLSEPGLETEVAGIKFKNPVGLAAGFDKNALVYKEMGYLGFGFVEIGTVTPKPQAGNVKPRLFRLNKDEGLINRMGFNNHGVNKITKRLYRKNSPLIIGGNIGKNKEVPNEEAYKDYETCFEQLFNYVDFFVVNVSSPNTPGLRGLQEKEPLTKLLAGLQLANEKHFAQKPIFLKIAPDLNNEQLDEIIDIVKSCKISGVIATNTTISREGLKTDVTPFGNGGLSGKPLLKRSTEVVKYIFEKSEGSFPIIASGGIHSVEDAIEKFEAGASMIELYTGFIYEGPKLIKDINKELLRRRATANFKRY
ncbi:MAG TPA: quinone-dependent dihydroorotate dehydrogenase [Bacteroidia bacterium]|jgi:dihydroorotate dehydrogenase|nr:quinone-dependent dihydroorotate dehydrogenase [Bacteroidia bacterium]